MHIDETKFGMHENQNATNTKLRDDAVMLVAKSNVEKARNQDARCTALLSRVAHARRAFCRFDISPRSRFLTAGQSAVVSSSRLGGIIARARDRSLRSDLFCQYIPVYTERI